MTMAAAMTGLGALLLALLYGMRLTLDPPHLSRSLVKAGSVALLAVTGLLLGVPALIVAGLALGAVGDWFLSRDGTPAFLAGMAAFALGHLAYAAAFVGPGGVALLPVLALIALALSTEIWLAPHTGALRWPVRGYVAVITLMAAAALTLPGDRGLALAGAGLFLLSDALLALDLFRVRDARLHRRLARLLWAAYWSGQALILAGMRP